MIILIGPDGTGKTTLARKLESAGLRYYHFTKDSNYLDYINPLCKLEMTDAVLDRHGICEYPYSICMNRPFKYNIKEWHNILTMTLIQNPVIVLCISKPPLSKYDSSQYLPYGLWDKCLTLYQHFLSVSLINHTTYEFTQTNENFVKYLLFLNRKFNDESSWWREHWRAGYGCAGSPNPDYLLVAERIGPNNMHNIPFETGPTGQMLSDMLEATGTPLGRFTVTNMVKSFRRDTRAVNAKDIELLQEEITNLQPKKVIFMGTPAKRGIPVAKSMGCEVGTLVHLGSLNYRGVSDMSGYHNEWKKMIGLLPVVGFKES
jgi:uracil-DNA glycosylase